MVCSARLSSILQCGGGRLGRGGDAERQRERAAVHVLARRHAADVDHGRAGGVQGPAQRGARPLAIAQPGARRSGWAGERQGVAHRGGGRGAVPQPVGSWRRRRCSRPQSSSSARSAASPPSPRQAPPRRRGTRLRRRADTEGADEVLVSPARPAPGRLYYTEKVDGGGWQVEHDVVHGPLPAGRGTLLEACPEHLANELARVQVVRVHLALHLFGCGRPRSAARPAAAPGSASAAAACTFKVIRTHVVRLAVGHEGLVGGRVEVVGVDDAALFGRGDRKRPDARKRVA